MGSRFCATLKVDRQDLAAIWGLVDIVPANKTPSDRARMRKIAIVVTFVVLLVTGPGPQASKSAVSKY